MSRSFSEDIDNIKVHLIYHLKPFVRKSLRRQFKLNITKRLYSYMKEEQFLTGRFMDAGHLIEELELPTSRGNSSLFDLLTLITGSSSSSLVLSSPALAWSSPSLATPSSCPAVAKGLLDCSVLKKRSLRYKNDVDLILIRNKINFKISRKVFLG